MFRQEFIKALRETEIPTVRMVYRTMDLCLHTEKKEFQPHQIGEAEIFLWK